MALQLKLDPTGVEQGAARAKSAIDGIVGSATKAESAVEALGKEGARDLGQLATGSQRAGQAASEMARNVDTAGRLGRNTGAQFQNASYQIADFAVQVGSGTSATRALAQQLPQLLGGFGLWGAAIGAVVAIGGAVAPMLLNMKDAAKEAADNIDALDTALSDYISYAKTATSSTATLQGQFGQFAEQIRQHAAFLANVQVSAATRELTNSATTFAASLDKVTASEQAATLAARLYFETASDSKADPAIAESYLEAFKVIADDAPKAAAAIGLTELQAISLNTALAALKTDSGGGMAEIHSEAAAVNVLLAQMTANGQKISPQMAELAAKMFDLEKASAEALDLQKQMPGALSSAAGPAGNLAAAISGGVDAMGALVAAAPGSGWLSGAIGDAERLWGALANAASAAAMASFNSTQPDLTGPAGMGSSPPTGGAVSTSPRPGQRGVDSPTFGTPHISGGSSAGGGGADPIAATQRAYDALMASLDPAIAASQKLAEAQKTINAEMATGKITTGQAAAATKLATAEYDKAIAGIKGVAGAWGDLNAVGTNAIDSLVGETATLSDALRNMAKELALTAVKALALQHITGGTSGMSLGGLIMQALTGGVHDAGGTIPNGTVGLVGERGPELVRAGSSGAVVTSRVDTARMMQGGGQAQRISVDVGVTVDDDGKIRAYVRKIGQAAAQAGAANAVQTVKRSLGTWNGQLQTDGAL